MSNMSFIHMSLFFIFLLIFHAGAGLKGAISLDSWTFDKMISKFKASLVKFDITYPYGEKEEEYGKIADSARFSPDLLISEVGVQDYGDKENSDIAERFSISKDDFPVLKLFVQGRDVPFTFSGKFQADDIKNFVKEHSSVRLVLDKCLPKFDEFAENFMSTSEDEKKENILSEAKTVAEGLTAELEKKSAIVYIKMMEKVMERGSGFIASEKERVKNIKEGKITTAKKDEMQGRLNIIQSFTVRDEL